MRIVVLGAAGGVGRAAVAHAAQRGHVVVAAARRLSPDLADRPAALVEPVVLDVRDAAAVRTALVGADAVLWCVGVSATSGPDVGRASLPGVLTAMAEWGVRRIVTISGAGVTVPGDRKGVGARAVSALTARLARDLVADKTGEHALLAAGDRDWTEVRAPRLVEAHGRGRYELTDRAPGLTAKALAKADAAQAMVDLAEHAGPWSRRSPFVVAAG